MGNALSVAAVVVGLLLTITALFASWRVTRNTQTTAVYRDTALAWQAKSESQAAEIADLKSAKELQVREIAELKGKVEFMQDALTGRSAWEILERRTAEMVQLAADARTDNRKALDLLTRNQESIRQLVGQIITALAKTGPSPDSPSPPGPPRTPRPRRQQ